MASASSWRVVRTWWSSTTPRGQDITRNILLQVISEQEQGGRPILSADMLKHIIRFYGNPLQEMMGGYLERSVEMFMSQQKTLQDQIQKTMGMTPFGTMQSLAQKNMEAWGQLQKSFLDMLTPRTGGGGQADAPTGHQPSPPPGDQSQGMSSPIVSR